MSPLSLLILNLESPFKLCSFLFDDDIDANILVVAASSFGADNFVPRDSGNSENPLRFCSKLLSSKNTSVALGGLSSSILILSTKPLLSPSYISITLLC